MSWALRNLDGLPPVEDREMSQIPAFPQARGFTFASAMRFAVACRVASSATSSPSVEIALHTFTMPAMRDGFAFRMNPVGAYNTFRSGSSASPTSPRGQQRRNGTRERDAHTHTAGAALSRDRFAKASPGEPTADRTDPVKGREGENGLHGPPWPTPIILY